MFATIPFIFSLQQLTEGILWTALDQADYSSDISLLAKIYIFSALVIWPFWIPLSIYWLEKDSKQKKVLWGLSALGTAFSFYMSYHLYFSNVSAEIIGNHIKYIHDLPFAGQISATFSMNMLENLTGIIYLAVTVVPHFYSSFKKVQVLGVSLFFSYFISKIFFVHYVFSTWCFFASIISLSIYLIIKSLNATKEPHYEYKKQPSSL